MLIFLILFQGFEFVINGRKYFAFSKYEVDSQGVATSYCDKTMAGWTHDVLGNAWACYKGEKSKALHYKASESPEQYLKFEATQNVVLK